jgi:hypothetical protein
LLISAAQMLHRRAGLRCARGADGCWRQHSRLPQLRIFP